MSVASYGVTLRVVEMEKDAGCPLGCFLQQIGRLVFVERFLTESKVELRTALPVGSILLRVNNQCVSLSIKRASSLIASASSVQLEVLTHAQARDMRLYTPGSSLGDEAHGIRIEAAGPYARVTYVKAGSREEQGGIREGDMILALNGMLLQTLRAAQKALSLNDVVRIIRQVYIRLLPREASNSDVDWNSFLRIVSKADRARESMRLSSSGRPPLMRGSSFGLGPAESVVLSHVKEPDPPADPPPDPPTDPSTDPLTDPPISPLVDSVKCREWQSEITPMRCHAHLDGSPTGDDDDEIDCMVRPFSPVDDPRLVDISRHTSPLPGMTKSPDPQLPRHQMSRAFSYPPYASRIDTVGESLAANVAQRIWANQQAGSHQVKMLIPSLKELQKSPCRPRQNISDEVMNFRANAAHSPPRRCEPPCRSESNLSLSFEEL
ncbi:MAG: hypothetical protein SGPRY_005603 [Prymnesium sp.]